MPLDTLRHTPGPNPEHLNLAPQIVDNMSLITTISPVENHGNDMGPTVTQELIPNSQDIRTHDSEARFEPRDHGVSRQ